MGTEMVMVVPDCRLRLRWKMTMGIGRWRRIEDGVWLWAALGVMDSHGLMTY